MQRYGWIFKTFRFTTFIGLTLLLWQSVYAATTTTILGHVVDAHDESPISGVSIQLQSQPEVTTTTDDEGKFALIVASPGVYIIQAYAEGYGYVESESISVSDNVDTPVIALQMSRLLSLPEMEVEGAPPPELNIGRTIISGKELEQIPGAASDPMTALRILPGVTTANDAEATIAVRGSGPQDNGAYVDFLHIGYLFHGFPMRSVLRSDLVDTFDLYAAGFGPEFGDVLGAVIDVKQRLPREDRIGGALNVSFLETDVLLEGPINDNNSFYVAGRRSYIDLILPKSFFEGDGIQVTEIPVYYDYQGKYVWRPNPFNTVSFQLIGANDKIKVNITDEAKEAKRDPAIQGEFGADTGFHSQGLVWTSDISHQLSNKLAFATLYTYFNLYIGDTGASRTGDVDVDVNNYYVRDELVWTPDIPHQFTLGFGLYRARIALAMKLLNAFCTEFDPDCNYSQGDPISNDETIWVTDGYVSLRDQWRITRNFTFSMGARYTNGNYLHKYYLEPRLAAEYRLSSKILLSAAWSKHNQFPEFVYVLEKFGNPDLTHSKATHHVLGLEYFHNDQWTTKIEAYYKTMEDLVVSDNNPDPLQNKLFLNEGSGKAYGAELLLKRHQVDDFSGWFSLTLSRSERTNELTGETFRYQLDRKVMINAVGIKKISERVSASVRLSFHSGGRYTPVIGSHEEIYTDENGNETPYRAAEYGEFNSRSLPPYHRMDLRFDYDYYNKKSTDLNLYVEIINAYNRKNVSGYSWNWNEDKQVMERETTTQLGIIPSLGMRIEW